LGVVRPKKRVMASFGNSAVSAPARLRLRTVERGIMVAPEVAGPWGSSAW
jgi:hypothetical protein